MHNYSSLWIFKIWARWVIFLNYLKLGKYHCAFPGIVPCICFFRIYSYEIFVNKDRLERCAINNSNHSRHNFMYTGSDFKSRVAWLNDNFNSFYLLAMRQISNLKMRHPFLGDTFRHGAVFIIETGCTKQGMCNMIITHFYSGYLWEAFSYCSSRLFYSYL